MKPLSSEVTALLDKLYNLRGEDSVVLTEMDKQKEKAEETKVRTTKEKKELQDKIAELEKQHEDLDEQGEKLVEVLSMINREDYATVLDRLKIDFDPQNIVSKINRSLPNTIDTVVLETKKAEEQLVKVEEEMNSAITTIDELGIRRDTALANQDKLNEYFELALANKINITRDSITSLLEQFNFNEEEQREAAKILMFPEDALFIYDEKLKNKSTCDIRNVKEEPVLEKEQDLLKTFPEEEIKLEVEEKKEITKDDIIKALSDNGINYLDYQLSDIDYLVDNFNNEIFKSNINLIKELNLGLDIFINHTKLLLDSKLEDKIRVLLEVGKEPIDIYLNPGILEKYDLDELNEAINKLKENGMDPKNVPLMAY